MYESLSAFYDTYMQDFDREALLEFVLDCFKKYGNPGIAGDAASKGVTDGTDIDNSRLVIDLGCGTGELLIELAKSGFDMTGLDISPEMLEIARENAESEGVNALWLCQDMTKMDTYGSYAAMLSTVDGVNHILSPKKIEAFFKRTINFVDPGGLFIFDFLTPEYFAEMKQSKWFADDRGDEGLCVWEGKFSEKTNICEYNITCFEPNGEGGFARYDDFVKERAYEKDFIVNALRNAGYKIILTKGKKRIFVVAKNERTIK